MATRIATLEAVITADTRKFNRGMKNVDRQLKKSDGSFQKMNKSLKTFGLLLGGAAVLGGIRSVVNAASDLEESINAVEVVFGDAAKEVLAFTSDTEDAVFATASSLNELATVTGSLLQNFGFNAKQAAAETITLTQRAADMASVFNVDVSDALMSINAAVRGETESIRRFGVNVDETAVKAKALELGLIGVGEALTQEAKVAARVAIIMEQTAKVQGDAANTAGSYANQLRRLEEQAEVAKVAVGQKLMPVMIDLLELTLDLVPVIGAVAESIGELAAFAGKTIKIAFELQGGEDIGADFLGLAGLAAFFKTGGPRGFGLFPFVIGSNLSPEDERAIALRLEAIKDEFKQQSKGGLPVDFRLNISGKGFGEKGGLPEGFGLAAANIIRTNIEGALAQQKLRMDLKGITIPEGPAVKAAKDLAGVFGAAFGKSFKEKKSIERALADAVAAVRQAQQIQSLITTLGALVPTWFLDGIVAGVDPGAAVNILTSFVDNPKPLLDAFAQTGINSADAAIAAMKAKSDAMVATWAAIMANVAQAGNIAFANQGGPGAPVLPDLGGFVPGTGQGVVGGRFHQGGIVPGPPGADVPILAQAGETVIPAGRGGGTTVILNVAGSIHSNEDILEFVRQGIRTNTIRGGSMEFA